MGWRMFSGVVPKGYEFKGTLNEKETNHMGLVRQELNGPDFFFPPHGGRPPSDEAVHAATQRYINKAKKKN